jgi:hypothetical protein
MEIGIRKVNQNYVFIFLDAKKKEVNEFASELRNIDGFYYNGFFIDKRNEYEIGFKIVNEGYLHIMDELSNNKIIINKKEMECIMATKQAPYKLWTLKALKNELKQREIDFTELEDSNDKAALVALLQADDNEPNKVIPTDDEIEDLESEDELDDEESEDEELEDELDDEESDDLESDDLESDDEAKAPAKKAPAKKAPPKKDEPAKLKKKAASKKDKGTSSIELNTMLREKNLWRPGCQFLSKVEKQELLDVNKNERQKIYDMLDKKFTKLKKKISETNKETNKAKKEA